MIKIIFFLKRIYRNIKRQIWERKIFKFAKPYLNRGVYYFLTETREIKQGMSLLYPHFVFLRKGGTDSLEYGVGSGKIVLLRKTTAHGYFLKKEKYFDFKRRYIDYCAFFNYPCTRIISFEDKDKCVEIERIYGKVYTDKNHNLLVVELLLDRAINAKIKVDSDNYTYFLQHGDVKPDNIIWENTESLRFIDLDGVDYYPPLFDLLHYLSSVRYSFPEIIEVLNQYEKTIKQICMLARIDTGESMIDMLLYRFLLFYKKLGAFFGDFHFLTIDNTVNYPKTNTLLLSML